MRDIKSLLLGSLGFLLTFLLGLHYFPYAITPDGWLGWDFPAFYVPNHLGLNHLYDVPAYIEYGRVHLAPLGVRQYPSWVRPAIFAFAWKPISLLPYWTAFWTMVGIGIGAYFASVYLLLRWLKLPLYLLALFGAFHPASYGIVFGHDAAIFSFVMLCALILLTERRDTAAGILLALCAYKFAFVLLVPFVLIAHRRWKALGWMSGLTAVEAAVSCWLVSPKVYIEALRQMSILQDPRTGSFTGALRGVLGQDMHREQWYLPIAAIGLVLCVYAISRIPLREGFCVALLWALTFGYKTSWYDYVLLVIPLAVAMSVARWTRPVVYVSLVLIPAWIIWAKPLELALGLLLLVALTASMIRNLTLSALQDSAADAFTR